MSLIERDALQAKLYEMVLHDDTGDPHDEGYMSAVNELQTWLDGRPSTTQGAVSETERLRHEVQARDDVIYHAAEHLRRALDAIAAYEDRITDVGGQ